MTSDELKAARKRLGMTQAQLAATLKLGKAGNRAVRRWERGERPISGPVEVAINMILGGGTVDSRIYLIVGHRWSDDETVCIEAWSDPGKAEKRKMILADDNQSLKAARAAQTVRYNEHNEQRLKHPNEDILKDLESSPRAHDRSYWNERFELFKPVYEAIAEWSKRFWEMESPLEQPYDDFSIVEIPLDRERQSTNI